MSISLSLSGQRTLKAGARPKGKKQGDETASRKEGSISQCNKTIIKTDQKNTE